jgi:hypothetical protein
LAETPRLRSAQKPQAETEIGAKTPRPRLAQKPQAENGKTMGTSWVLMKWSRNGFVEMGFFEREMEMEMGWRVE